jgi:hypothetical protein
MALKDLVADRGKIDEAAIEAIVSRYVRFDLKRQQVVFLPDSRDLNQPAKVLVYLVALMGWQYILEAPKPVSTKPADLEAVLGIAGGSMRRILMELKDGHLVTTNDGHYAAQIANLDAIAQVVAGESKKPAVRGKAAKEKPRPKLVTAVERAPNEPKKKASASGQLRTTLEKWIKQGLFAEAQTIGTVQARYHEQAIIAKQSSLSGLLLRAVRDGLLVRKKTESAGKTVWVYRAP